MTGAGPEVAAGSIIGDHHADDALIAVFGAACAEAARLDTEATHAVRRGAMYALDDRIGQLRTDRDRLAAELAAARAEVERLTGDLAEWMQHVAEVNAHALRMQDRALAAERERDEARAELVLLDEVCAHYALDEVRFFRDEGEPFGSVPIEAGIKARQAGGRYAEREAAELAERRGASERVLADPAADEIDRHDAQIAVKCVGYALERIAPLRAAALDPSPRGATGPSGTRDGRGEVGDV